jgi:hypothetical protein
VTFIPYVRSVDNLPVELNCILKVNTRGPINFNRLQQTRTGII